MTTSKDAKLEISSGIFVNWFVPRLSSTMFTCDGEIGMITFNSAWNIHPGANVYRKTRQLVLFHVQLLKVISTGENAVGDSVAHVVLHVEGCDVDELGWSARRISWELVSWESYWADLIQGCQEAVRKRGNTVVLYVELFQVDAVGERSRDIAGVQLVVAEAKSAQLGEVADLWGQVQELVVLQVEGGELAALADLGRQVLKLVVAAVARYQRFESADSAW